ncbi:unnamed protein product [Strongylus vulgaris]|uniref:Uncharacterized protein n=1 Tax=Strongylus vulgaris TaxID=40348 RepID=A0A3P7LUH5_STRVU|nr:unnamed protein product [Strongylus vulgaris]
MVLEGSPNAETSSYIYLGRSMNMENNRPLKEATDQLTDPELRDHLLDSTVLPTSITGQRRGHRGTSEALRTTYGE